MRGAGTMDGDSNSVCAFRRRMLEMVQETETPQPEETRGRRCLFSMLPPWLVPQSFGKVAVFLADPRYLIMRQLKMWEMFQRRATRGASIGHFKVLSSARNILKQRKEPKIR